MKISRAIATVAICVLASTTALAGPAAPKRICGSAAWAVHVDVEALTESALAAGMVELITGKDSPIPAGNARRIAECWKKVGTVKSVTLFGPSIEEAEAVVTAELVKYDRREIEKFLGVVEGGVTRAHGKHTLHEFVAKSGRGKRGHRGKGGVDLRYVCFYDANTIIAGGDLRRLGQALDLLDGKGKALAADSELAGLLTPTKGSVLIAAATGVKDLAAAAEERDPAVGVAVMLKKVQGLRVEIGELEGEAFIAVKGVMATEQDAQNIRKMGEGLLALASLQPQEDKDVAALLQAIKISGEGKAVGVGVAMSVEDILSKFQAKMIAKVAEAIE